MVEPSEKTEPQLLGSKSLKESAKFCMDVLASSKPSDIFLFFVESQSIFLSFQFSIPFPSLMTKSKDIVCEVSIK